MEISTFRAIKAKLLRNQPSHVVEESERRIQVVLDLLDQETLSKEAMAVIISQVKSELQH